MILPHTGKLDTAISALLEQMDFSASTTMRQLGEKNGRSKLTEVEVVTIRERHAAGETRKALALEYGLAVSSVGRIVTGQKWPHAPGPIEQSGCSRDSQTVSRGETFPVENCREVWYNTGEC